LVWSPPANAELSIAGVSMVPGSDLDFLDCGSRIAERSADPQDHIRRIEKEAR